jgi:twinkle protein
MIVRPNELLTDVQKIYDEGIGKGYSTGWANVDEFLTIKPKQLTIITGMPSHGKSEWLDALCVNLARLHQFRVCFFSPENHPLEMHCKKIIEKIAHKPFWGNHRMDKDTMDKAMDVANKYFSFVKIEETAFRPTDIIDEALPWLDMSAMITAPKALVIDPWNEMDHSRPSGLSETEYISQTLTVLRKAAREFDVHLFLVAHPMKLQKQQDGNYPVPKPYDISGSAHWYNKADNAIAIWRDVVNEPERTEVHIQKVRFNSNGHPGMTELYYDYKRCGYVEKETFYKTL